LRFEVVISVSVKAVAFRPDVGAANFCEPTMHAYAIEANNIYVLKKPQAVETKSPLLFFF